MALVDDDLSADGTKFAIFEDDCKGELLHAMVVPMPFYDPEGTCMKM